MAEILGSKKKKKNTGLVFVLLKSSHYWKVTSKVNCTQV